MPKETGRNDRRSAIAYLAARLMAEDGIEDYALAKRKAARQAGLPDTRDLPSNDEIEAALKAHQQIYQRDTHHDRLRALRETALRVMRELAQFDPHLTGPVLAGTAGKYAGISLQLFVDSAKAVELYLIDRGIPYHAAESRLYFSGSERLTALVYTFEDDDSEIELTVLSTRELRGPLRTGPDGKNIERARIATVERLLAGP